MSDTLDISLAHNAWATNELLRVCEKLDDAQWHRRFDMGPGSLHDTLTHIVGAMLVHVTTHGMHHRAQCLNMLRRLELPGVSDALPDLDVLEWQLRAK